MKTFTLNINDEFDSLLEELKNSLGKTSKAEVLRLAIALLKLADEAKNENQKLTISSQDGRVIKEIVLPQ